MDAGAIWILSRQKLVMADWPDWGDQLDVRTWVRPIKGPLVHRDYEMLVGDRKVGECAASWLTLDVRTRRPVRPALAGARLDFRLDGALALTPEKIALRQDLAESGQISVRNSDLDVNGHVNNTRYAQWILDSTPLEARSDLPRRPLRSEFSRRDSGRRRRGDRGRAARGVVERAKRRLQFQGRRLSDGAHAFAAVLGVVDAVDRAGAARPRFCAYSLFANNSRPISMRRISLVPAPIS